ncbi:hypothetical protein [Natronobeatus ordinarius]|nr:hypothetical protein [Natronobeatus ordinarius]
MRVKVVQAVGCGPRPDRCARSHRTARGRASLEGDLDADDLEPDEQ